MPPQPPLCCAVLSLKIWASKNLSTTCNRKPHFVPAPLLVGIELNPGPEQLSEKERWWIVFLSQENGRNPSQIAREVGCTRQTVYDVLARERETGHVRNRTGSGRKRKLTTEEEKRVIKRAQKVGATQAAREFSTRNPKKVSDCTVRKTLKKYKFFYLKKKTNPKAYGVSPRTADDLCKGNDGC